MRCLSPPALACRLIEFFLPVANREAIMGDLIEEYTLRVKSRSPFTASRWFWGQACRSVPCLLGSSLGTGNCLTTLSIAMGVYLFMAMLKFAADFMISKWVASNQTTHVVLAPIVFLTITAMGGCVAARIRRAATIFLALIVMITVTVLISINVCSIPVPWWYQFGFLTLGPSAVLITPAMFWSLKPRAEGPVD
jgi:hypothetical protein